MPRRPEVGDVVLYTTRNPERVAESIAAIVTAVHSDEVVSLRCFPPGDSWEAARVDRTHARAGSETARGRWTDKAG